MTSTITLRQAAEADRADLITLLQQNDLLIADLPSSLSGFVLARDGGHLIGAAGLETYLQAGLLRSVAVAPTHRNQHLAHQLVTTALTSARQQGLTALYLITTTADAYFTRYGFTPIDRQQVPVAIAHTQQFNSLCPASAVVMQLVL